MAQERRSLNSLRLTDFRSYTATEVAPGQGLIAISGPNGAGKPNLLEAISLLAPGRGLRRATLGEMARGGRGRLSGQPRPLHPPGLGDPEALAARMPNARFLLIPASAETFGHGTHTHPEFWKDELGAFLREDR